MNVMTTPYRFARAPRGLALLLAVALAALAGTSVARADTTRFRVLTETSQLGFHATSRLANADGRFTRFAGEVLADPADLASGRVRVSIEAASLDTGIGRRDNHLRSEDFLYVERFPAITFESTRVEGDGGRLVLVGRLTLRGVTREVRVPVEVSVADGRLEARGRFDINRGDYGVSYDSVLNPIGQKIRIDFALRAQAIR
jgi:polyisoprenoid-binding protein YceI